LGYVVSSVVAVAVAVMVTITVVSRAVIGSDRAEERRRSGI
jgi:hypothetical protein